MRQMRNADPEDEKVIPRISPTHFTKEKSSRELELDSGSHISLLEFNDEWRVIGWAYANDVAPREMCNYVVLCERNGFQIWCHIATFSFELMVEKVRKNPSRIVSLH